LWAWVASGEQSVFFGNSLAFITSVGYAGGYTPNPTYEEVCSGLTGHTEVLMAVYDSWNLSLMDMLRVFWENHNPTQGMRQGNDMGTQYRSAIYYANDEQRIAAEESRDAYQVLLTDAGFGEITTEIAPLTDYFYAEPYHQQYLGKNPNGYCGIGGTGVSCSIGIL
jgi:peptide-methionine (S)-S-oxide reductase